MAFITQGNISGMLFQKLEINLKETWDDEAMHLFRACMD
jgi:predicted metal-binding protein